MLNPFTHQYNLFRQIKATRDSGEKVKSSDWISGQLWVYVWLHMQQTEPFKYLQALSPEDHVTSSKVFSDTAAPTSPDSVLSGFGEGTGREAARAFEDPSCHYSRSFT